MDTCDCDGGSDLKLQKNKSVKQEFDVTFVSQNSHMSNGIRKVFIILKTHFTLLGELAFSKLDLILTPTSVLSALFGHGRLFPGVLAIINSHPFLDPTALLIPFLVKIELFFSPGLRSSFCLPPKSHASAI